MAICRACGREFHKKSHHKGGGEAVYCSRECLEKKWTKRTTAICMFCGKEFKETRDRPNYYCSKSCSIAANARSKALEKKLENEVREETERALEEAIALVEELTEKIRHERRCQNCGRWFDQRESKRNKFCSKKCRNEDENRRKNKRLEKNGKPDLTISLTKLYMRDGGICQICGKAIDFDRDPNADDYPSIDHIVPLSKGGLHRWDNVQLACRRCNYIKGDKIATE